MGGEAQYATSKALEARMALHRRYADPEKDTFRAAWRLFPFQQGMRVLEVGCGTGAFWQHPEASPSSESLHLVLTDSSSGMLTRARELLGGRPRLTWSEADVTALPYPDAAFDAVVCNFVLPSVDDPDRAAAEMARVLRPTGFAGITLPGRAHMRDVAVAAGAPGIASFCAEDAADLLGLHFGAVHTVRLVDTMRVNDVEPLVAWLASVPGSRPEHLARLQQVASDAIRSKGHFPIRRATGLFVCREPRTR